MEEGGVEFSVPPRPHWLIRAGDWVLGGILAALFGAVMGSIAFEIRVALGL